MDAYGAPGTGLAGLDWPGQFQAQLLGLATIGVWALLVSLALFQTIKVVATSWSRAGLELADRSLAESASIEPPPAEAPDS